MTIFKTLVSPLFWFLVLCFGRGLYAISRGKLRARGDVLLLIATTLIAIASMPAVGTLAARSVVPREEAASFIAKRTIVVVLAGGSYQATDGRPQLSGATIDRVLAGVATFRSRRATSMIMTGRGHDADPGASVRLMRELAINLGVPANRIAVEPRSFNTREHPVEIKRLQLATSDDLLVVVTEPSHLRRSLIEFRRHFRQVTGVLATAPPRVEMRIDSFIPQADALDETTTALREIVGMAWYELRQNARR